jgi:hypothetical protein
MTNLSSDHDAISNARDSIWRLIELPQLRDSYAAARRSRPHAAADATEILAVVMNAVTRRRRFNDDFALSWLEQTDRALNEFAATVGFGIQDQRTTWFAAVPFVFRGDDGVDATTAKPIANPRHIATLVAGQP